jgi:hypothetical protein
MNNESDNKRKRFLKRFAALSSAAILAGTGAGCGDEEVEYGPPPVEPTTQTQPDEPTVEYGPPPVDETADNS